MTLLPAPLWVAIIPTKFSWAAADFETKLYYLSEPTFLEGLLRPDSAALLRGVRRFMNVRDAVALGPRADAIELTQDGEITYDGRKSAPSTL